MIMRGAHDVAMHPALGPLLFLAQFDQKSPAPIGCNIGFAA
jgi:hypothetical protein